MSDRRCFTLIELIISMTLFAAILSAFGFVMKSGFNSILSLKNKTQAAFLLQAKMEEIRSAPFNSLPSLHGKIFAGGGNISIFPLSSDLAAVTVELKWAERKPALRYYTLRSPY